MDGDLALFSVSHPGDGGGHGQNVRGQYLGSDDGIDQAGFAALEFADNSYPIQLGLQPFHGLANLPPQAFGGIILCQDTFHGQKLLMQYIFIHGRCPLSPKEYNNYTIGPGEMQDRKGQKVP